MKPRLTALVVSSTLVLGSVTAVADGPNCAVSRAQLKTAMGVAESLDTGGYDLDMWLVMVNETGTVCHVMNSSGVNGRFTGNFQWLGSRVIAAQKAFTANAFSLNTYAISTANLFTATQPGNSLFELPESNPVDPRDAYRGPANKWGTADDPLRGKRMGGVNVFGGGLPIYKYGVKVGAIGVSGDTSCRDHAYAFAVRQSLDDDGVAGPQPGGVGITTSNFEIDGSDAVPLTGASTGDEMILDLNDMDVDEYWANWEHALCPNTVITNGVIQN